jgi:hypothetical protein
VTVQLATCPSARPSTSCYAHRWLRARRAPAPATAAVHSLASLLVVSGNARSPRTGGPRSAPPRRHLPYRRWPHSTNRVRSRRSHRLRALAGTALDGPHRRLQARASMSAREGSRAGPQAAVTGLLGNSGLADVPGPDSTLTPLDQRPPMPLLRPSSAPDAANPFGRVVGSATPGAVVGTASPRILYSPITEQNVGSAPGVSPSASPATAPK